MFHCDAFISYGGFIKKYILDPKKPNFIRLYH